VREARARDMANICARFHLSPTAYRELRWYERNALAKYIEEEAKALKKRK
jgi:hypothetical protein